MASERQPIEPADENYLDEDDVLDTDGDGVEDEDLDDEETYDDEEDDDLLYEDDDLPEEEEDENT